MVRATWKGAVLAQSDDTIVVEGNHYFRPDDLAWEHFRPSPRRTYCGWKGHASYYDVVVGGAVNVEAAWFYPNPMPAAADIKDRIAFWHGVAVEQIEASPATKE